MLRESRLHRLSIPWLGLVILAVVSAAPGAYAVDRSNWHPSETLTPEDDASPPPAADAKPTPNSNVMSKGEAELLALAKKGDTGAQNRLGVIYVEGVGVAKNIPEGLKWFHTAADAGHAAAQLNLGIMYANGVGVPKDYTEAAKWYRRAAEQGDAGGQNSLGFLYEHGLGTVQNFAEALMWYRRAVSQHKSEAQFNLAQMLEKGEGTPKDDSAAARLLRAAADQGNVPAQINLAVYYLTGRAVPRDPSLGYFWSVLGAAHAKPNQLQVAVAVRDKAAKELNSEEVSRLQGLAEQWKPGVDVTLLVGPPRPGVEGAASMGAMMIGTGFVVAKEGYVLTNAHVVPACKSVSVRTPEGVTTDATLVTRDERSDLALLKVAGPSAHVSTFREDRGVRQGDSVIAYGFPLAGLLSDQGNLTLGTVSALAGAGNDSHLFQISAPVQPGNSGGPVIDSSGNIVGVVVSKLNALNVAKVTGDVAQNINFAIKEGVARDFLDANGVNYQTAKSAREIKTADLAEQARQFTVRVNCSK